MAMVPVFFRTKCRFSVGELREIYDTGAPEDKLNDHRLESNP